jgi:hypothetical protein
LAAIVSIARLAGPDRLVYNPPKIQSLTVWLRDWRLAALFATAWGVALAIPSAAAIVMIVRAFEPTAKERQACDQTVATVLTTKDPLELERAMFLVQQLRCGIGKHL